MHTSNYIYTKKYIAGYQRSDRDTKTLQRHRWYAHGPVILVITIHYQWRCFSLLVSTCSQALLLPEPRMWMTLTKQLHRLRLCRNTMDVCIPHQPSQSCLSTICYLAGPPNDPTRVPLASRASASPRVFPQNCQVQRRALLLALVHRHCLWALTMHLVQLAGWRVELVEAMHLYWCSKAWSWCMLAIETVLPANYDQLSYHSARSLVFGRYRYSVSMYRVVPIRLRVFIFVAYLLDTGTVLAIFYSSKYKIWRFARLP